MCWLSCVFENSFKKNKITKKQHDSGASSSSSCSNVAEEIISKPMQKTIKLIHDESISQFEREKLCEALGKSMNLDIYRDSMNLKHSYTNMEKTKEIDSRTYLMSFYRPLVRLLVGMADISLNSTTKKKMHALCLAVEQIYYTRNLTFIGTFSFSTSLVKWSLHGSKSSHALDGCSYPSGSVTTLRKFLQSSSQDENKCFGSVDVEVWADNTQRKGKTSRVWEDGTTPISIATNVVFIHPNPVTHIQKIYELSPRHWPNAKENIPLLIR